MHVWYCKLFLLNSGIKWVKLTGPFEYVCLSSHIPHNGENNVSGTEKWTKPQHKDSQQIIQINHQLDATISQVFYLTLIYSSTCFGRPHAHQQELNNGSSSLWFYFRSVVIAVLLVVVGSAGPNITNSTATTTLQRKTRGCYCSC